MMIKPIQTSFDGHRFRSRLEARWAVKFIVMPIPYQYEVEGYVFNGRTYLPDFYFRRNGIPDIFIEIKGTLPDNEILTMHQDFINEGNGKNEMFIMCGDVCGDNKIFHIIQNDIITGQQALRSYIYFLHSFFPLAHPGSCAILDSSASMIAKKARFEHGEKPYFRFKLSDGYPDNFDVLTIIKMHKKIDKYFD